MKIALITNDDSGMLQFRGGLIKALVSKGMEVFVIVPSGPYVEKLEAIGAKSITVEIKRFLNPIQDIKLVWQFYRIFTKEKFDLVHTITIKPNLFGTIAAKAAGIERIVCLVSGIGFIFSNKPGLLTKMIRPFVMYLYKNALSISEKTWFQNQDDLDYFVERRLIDPKKGVVIKGSGVNLIEYSKSAVKQSSLESIRREFHIPSSSRCVVMITSRLIWSKGIREFVEAVEILKTSYPEWTFIMVSPVDPGSPDSVPLEYLQEHRSEEFIIIEDYRLDIKNFIELAEIMVLVSYYREGVPRILLEALSMSKPIVTSNSVGCKEVVEDGKNGFLVPAKNSKALAEKLTILMDDENKRRRFGERSRRMAEEFFDENLVINRVFTELYGL
jgi:N,N'-diacetylbacillosaminyl-diphospho-undecaprenol alpha-1,3-N-acetylgalactosaminyltransferase